MENRSFSNNKSPLRKRGNSLIGGGLANLREVEDDLEDGYEQNQIDMINDLNS